MIYFRNANEAVTLRSVIGKYACSIYALESMLYLTTGIMDKYDNTNIELETAIFKVNFIVHQILLFRCDSFFLLSLTTLIINHFIFGERIIQVETGGIFLLPFLFISSFTFVWLHMLHQFNTVKYI